MKKEVFVVFDEYPFGTNHLSEKLRMSLGLTINDNISLNLLFLEKGKQALNLKDSSSMTKDILKNINMLNEMGAKFYIESGDTPPLENIAPETFSRDGLEKVFDNADIIIN